MTKRRKTPIELTEIEPQICTIHVRLKILRQLPFFKGLTDEAISEINTRFRAEGYTADEFIYFAGESSTKLYVVAEGKVKLLRHAPTGQEVILDVLLPGEFFGGLPILGENTHTDTAQAYTPGCVLTITGNEFQKILEQYPSVSLTLLEIVSARLLEAREAIHQLSASPVESRLAITLLKLADKLGKEQDNALLIQLPLSRRDLADMTGATVETISRLMSQFRKQKLLDSGRRWVAITDRDRLKEIAAL
ncbi:MAG: Crp/Fnr family transcriptional regulator [Anaerolineae bacterium]|nr:Crp/Fnr family transcriptional regulator [Anaerolineae bacterium]